MPRPLRQIVTEHDGRYLFRYRFDDGISIWTRWEPEQTFYRFPAGSKFLVPNRFEALIDLPAVPAWTIRLDFEEYDGRPACQTLSIGPKASGPLVEPNGDDLRKIPVRRLIRLAITSVLHVEPSRASRKGQAQHVGQPPSLDDFEAAFTAVEHGDVAPGRRRELDDDHYRRVAAIYREQEPTGKPTQGVARTMLTSVSTAARWVMKARELGYLGPTAKGRPGEIRERGTT